MKTTTHALTAAALALAFALSPLQAAPPPGILNHQGRIAVSGANYTGTGHFKFALVDAAGTTTLWSNNGSSTGGAQPSAAVQVSVSQGHYALGLGDTALANMTAAIPPSVFTGNADVRLRVWFSTNGTTFEQLTPDRRITAAAYALTAGAVADPSFLGTTGNTPLDLSVNNQRALRLEIQSVGASPNLIGGFSGNSIAAGASGAVIGGGGSSGNANSITATGGGATIAGGAGNTASNANATIGGGVGNAASGLQSVVGGGSGNTASQGRATVGGGLNNAASGGGAVVSGGSGNVASGSLSTVPGGDSNTAGQSYAFAAGRRAKALQQGAFVWADSTDADFQSTANNQFLIRAAGGVGINKNNPAVALDVNGTVRATAFEGMGAPLLFATTDNQPLDFSVNGQRAFRLQPNTGGTPSIVGGWSGNSIAPGLEGAVIAGGGGADIANSITADGDYGFIGGGYLNSASGYYAVVSGGVVNVASGPGAVVSGGELNGASEPGAVVSGGSSNVASGFTSTVPGGLSNTASGNYSLAAGQRAKALHQGAFVWADAQGADFESTANDQFNVRAAGGARLFTGGTGLKLDTDTVVFSGSAQRARFGDAANVDFNPLTSLNGLLLEQGNSESSGLFFDGDSITMWSPGDNGRLFRILDEDLMAGGAVAAERFYIDGTGGIFSAGGATIAGNVGIGTASPGATLEVFKTFVPNVENSVFQVRATNGAGTLKMFEVYAPASPSVSASLRLDGFNAFKGGGGSWAVLSDARLKKNVEDLHGSLDRLLRLRSVSFDYKDPAKGVGPGPQIGFIAQEVREVLPQWVTEGSDGMLAVSVTGFESMTVDALRELRAEKDRQIAVQGAQLAELKAQNTALQNESAALKERLDRLERAVAALPLAPAAPVATTASLEAK